MLYWLFYLMSMADKLSTVFLTFSWIFTAAGIISNLSVLFSSDSDRYSNYYQPNKEVKEPLVYAQWYINCRFLARSLLFLCPLFWVLYVGTPTKKEAVLIIAGGYIGTFIQSDSNAAHIPADITRFLRVQINKATEESSLSDLLDSPKQKRIDSLKALTKEEIIQGLTK